MGRSQYQPTVSPAAACSQAASIIRLLFFFNDTATTEIYTLSLHDALPIFSAAHHRDDDVGDEQRGLHGEEDRKSTRLNSSHQIISYAVFCLKKKKRIK